MSWNLSKAERKFYFQKVKCRYMINCDQSTKLFYAAVERNAKKKHILAVVKEDGTVTTSAEEVIGTFMATQDTDMVVFYFGPRVLEGSWNELPWTER